MSGYAFNGSPGKIIANARSATAIHNGALPLTALTMAITRARIARTKLIDIVILLCDNYKGATTL